MSRVSVICTSLPSSIRDAATESIASSIKKYEVVTVNLDVHKEEKNRFVRNRIEHKRKRK
ncbi:MAG TPA: hypothetical protein VK190_03525 [Pseudoneobacillus sp.]|nr:hypothetical protein [Pseudoneobacillus sp.]